jgi:hypothetical protein
LAAEAPLPAPASAPKADASGNDARQPTTTHAGYPVDPVRAALDKKAKEHMATHPGVSYLAAVIAVSE